MIISKWIASACVCASLAIGCGGGSGGSGVDGTLELVELEADEVSDLCGYVIDQLGPTREIACPDGTLTIEAQTQAECEADFDTLPLTCTATVSNAEACAEAIGGLSDDELCSGDALPAACAPLFSASCSGQ